MVTETVEPMENEFGKNKFLMQNEDGKFKFSNSTYKEFFAAIRFDLDQKDLMQLNNFRSLATKNDLIQANQYQYSLQAVYVYIKLP